MEKLHPKTIRLVINIFYLLVSIVIITGFINMIYATQDNLDLGKFEISGINRNKDRTYEINNKIIENNEFVKIIIRHNHIDDIKINKFKVNKQEFVVGKNAHYNKYDSDYDEITINYKIDKEETEIILNDVVIDGKNFLFFKRKFRYRNNEIIKIKFVGD